MNLFFFLGVKKKINPGAKLESVKKFKTFSFLLACLKKRSTKILR